MNRDPATEELLRLTQRLLESIAEGDWKTYEELCDPSLSCFEPEARGQLVEGLAFHRFYFDLARGGGARNTTIASPHVRVMGDVAVVSYTRLNQRVADDDQPSVAAVNETRVWQRTGGRWRHVHFHRSGA
jgi:calcium/calmodulin-dependent protein kinase (CaM kinase) II